MKHIHAFWRCNYLKIPSQKKQNLFKNLPLNDKNQDKSNLILYRSQFTYIVLNKFPYNAGHLLVIPYRQIKTIEEMHEKEQLDFLKNIIKSQNILTKSLKPNGFNIGINIGKISGAGIEDHIHCHIVPRWNGDTNFMPVICNTKIISQSIYDIYDALYKAMNNM